MKKIAFAVPAIAAVSAFAEDPAAGMTTLMTLPLPITAIGATATSAFNTFSTTIVPLLLGGLVVVGGLTLGKWVIKKIRP